jgi:outer membrane protein OmpA-like peptidoglycan-associated protein
MRNKFLISALALALGGGVAVADTGDAQPAKTAPAQKTAELSSAPVDLFFNTDSADLKDTAGTDLQKLADWARCNPKAAIILEGHADASGANDYNVKLSGQRAAMVRQKLIGMGVPSDHIVVSVYGETGAKPQVSAQDRRVTARGVERPINASDLAT